MSALLFISDIMAYSRAVWYEKGREMEDGLPTVWIDRANMVVRFPKTDRNLAMESLTVPEDDWLTFAFQKIKYSAGSIYIRVS